MVSNIHMTGVIGDLECCDLVQIGDFASSVNCTIHTQLFILICIIVTHESTGLKYGGQLKHEGIMGSALT